MADKETTFKSNEDFRKFLNTRSGFLDTGAPSVESPQFSANPLDYLDEDGDLVNPEFIKSLKKAGGTSKEIDFLNQYIGLEDSVRKNKKAFSEGVSSLVDKAIESKNPQIYFDPSETLYRGSRVSKNTPAPAIGDIVEFDRFRSTSPDPYTATRFAEVSGKGYLSPELADEFFGKGNRGRVEVIEPLHGGLRLGNPLSGEDSEVILKPGKFKVTDRQVLDDVEYLKYKQIYGLDPAAAGIKGGYDLLRKNRKGAAIGAAASLLNPEVAKAVDQDRYQDAAKTAARDIVGGALIEAGIKAAAPAASKVAPGLVGAVAPVARFAGPAATGAALFSQGQTGSLTDVITKKAADFVPGLRADPETDIGRRAGNELIYMLKQFREGKIPYTNPN